VTFDGTAVDASSEGSSCMGVSKNGNSLSKKKFARRWRPCLPCASLQIAMQAYLAKKYGNAAGGDSSGTGTKRRRKKKKQSSRSSAAVRVVDEDDLSGSGVGGHHGGESHAATDDSWAHMQNPEDAPVVVNEGEFEKLRQEQQAAAEAEVEAQRAKKRQEAERKARLEAELASRRRAAERESGSDSDLEVARPRRRPSRRGDRSSEAGRAGRAGPETSAGADSGSDSDMSVDRSRGGSRQSRRPARGGGRRRRHDSDASSDSGSASSDSDSDSDSSGGGRRRRRRVGSSDSDNDSDSGSSSGSDLDVRRRGTDNAQNEAARAAARAKELADAAPTKFTGQLTKEQFTAMMKARAARDEAALIASGVDLSAASNAQTTFRDSTTGKKIDKVGEYMRDKFKDDHKLTPEQIAAQKLEWGKGSKQKESEAAARARLAAAKDLKFARREGEEGQDQMLKQQLHADDPMYQYFQKKMDDEDTAADLEEEKGSSAAAAALSLNGSGPGRKRRRKYRGKVKPPPHRFGNEIQPGYRWDGTNRSNGFEQRLLQAMNASRVRASENYKWSVSDM